MKKRYIPFVFLINFGTVLTGLCQPAAPAPAPAAPAPSRKVPLVGEVTADPAKFAYRSMWVLSPNIGVPAFRINPIDSGGGDTKAKVSAFNSISIGAMFNFGTITSSSATGLFQSGDNFKNMLGFGAGLLFAVDGKSNSGNVIAPIVTIGFLNFQIFGGYDFGDVPSNFDRKFVGLAYGLSFSNLIGSASDFLLTKRRTRAWATRNNLLPAGGGAPAFGPANPRINPTLQNFK